MSHKIEAILERVRHYQLPNWQYQSIPLMNPYRLASLGYQPSALNVLKCQICLHEVRYSDDPEDEVQRL
jgi:hypothetical protein